MNTEDFEKAATEKGCRIVRIRKDSKNSVSAMFGYAIHEEKWTPVRWNRKGRCFRLRKHLKKYDLFN